MDADFKTNVDTDIQVQVKEATGVTFNRDAFNDLNELHSNLSILNNRGEYTQDEVDAAVEAMKESVVIPEVIEEKEELDETLGLSAEDLKALYQYVSGQGTKPDFLDKYLADNDNKLRDFQHIMTLIRLSTIPQLCAMQMELQKRLYSPENLLNMDIKELSQASANLGKEMTDIINSANKAIELINSMGRPDSKYRSLIDKLLVMPEDVLQRVEHLIDNYD